jgi:hypothetical protein
MFRFPKRWRIDLMPVGLPTLQGQQGKRALSFSLVNLSKNGL